MNAVILPPAHPHELSLRELMSVEYVLAGGETLQLRRPMSRPLVVGQRFEGAGVAHGKLLEFMGTGRFAPVGFDLLDDADWPQSRTGGPLWARFADGAAAIAESEPLGARCYCSCGERGPCPHRIAILFLLGTTADAASHWFLSDDLVTQLRDAARAYRAERNSSMALLLLCDAGYVCLRDRFSVELDDKGLRRRLAAVLGQPLGPPPSIRHEGASNALASAFGRI